jgi:hypothetical protein
MPSKSERLSITALLAKAQLGEPNNRVRGLRRPGCLEHDDPVRTALYRTAGPMLNLGDCELEQFPASGGLVSVMLGD